MTLPILAPWNYCKWNSSTSGTGSFTVGTAAASDAAGTHDVPENCNVTSGNSYRYFAESADGSQWEWGQGTYSKSSHQLARGGITSNSDGTTSPVNFATDPVVSMFPNPSQSLEMPGEGYDHLPSGTRMLFQQTAAPTGWTKDTTYNDYALRVVSGTTGSGGINTFSATFSYRTSDGTSLSVAQLASHAHGPGAGTSFWINGQTPGNFWNIAAGTGSDNDGDTLTSYVGSGSAHTHTYDMRVKYVDTIIASKN